jgi:subtilisin family serine protease
MSLSRSIAAGVLCGVAAVACRPDSAVTPRSTEPAVTRTLSASAVSAAAVGSEGSNRYLVVFRSAAGANELADEINASGGLLEGVRQDLGFAVVSGISADAAARLRGAASISAVEADIEFALEPIVEAEAVDMTDAGLESATAPQTASQFARQWNMRAIAGPTAWAAGFLGSSEVRVAILDTGIDYLWPDLNGRVDLTRSISLRPDEDARFHTWFPTSTRHPITDLNAHGTMVSAIVASNATFFAGVTSRTTLFGVKVCIVFNTCSTAAILNGIVYAVDQGADVINMSLGGAFLKSANPGFVSVINGVFNYANQHGTVIVVASGNEAADIDHTGNVYFTYCNSPHVVCVSATGPTAAPTAGGPFTNPDAPAPYTNYGRSAISLAAPGGGLTTPSTGNVFVTGPCSSTSLAWFQPPRDTLTGVLPPPVILGAQCPLPGLFLLRGAGTSFASPHVAGVAAQVVSQIGHGQAAAVRARLQQSADDLGQPGTDPFYGKGRVNLARAVGATP